MTLRKTLIGASLSFAISASALAQSAPSFNFTGPLVTPNPKSLSPGSLLVEPYLSYSYSDATYDDKGRRRGRASNGQWRVSGPIGIGISDRFGMQLNVGAVHSMSGNQRTSGWRTNDSSLRLLYMLQLPNADGTRPAISVGFVHRFPTGPYQRLGDNPLNGTGAGASVNTVELMAQQIVYNDAGHAFRWRARLGHGFKSGTVGVEGVSVYGTPRGFQGHASRGREWSAQLGMEYMFGQHWGVAMDLTGDYRGPTRVHGLVPTDAGNNGFWSHRSSRSTIYSIAPAVEYNFSRQFGLVAGVQMSLGGRNASAFTTPMVAFNMVF